jgi:hypothetical protein
MQDLIRALRQDSGATRDSLGVLCKIDMVTRFSQENLPRIVRNFVPQARVAWAPISVEGAKTHQRFFRYFRAGSLVLPSRKVLSKRSDNR